MCVTDGSLVKLLRLKIYKKTFALRKRIAMRVPQPEMQHNVYHCLNSIATVTREQNSALKCDFKVLYSRQGLLNLLELLFALLCFVLIQSSHLHKYSVQEIVRAVPIISFSITSIVLFMYGVHLVERYNKNAVLQAEATINISLSIIFLALSVICSNTAETHKEFQAVAVVGFLALVVYFAHGILQIVTLMNGKRDSKINCAQVDEPMV